MNILLIRCAEETLQTSSKLFYSNTYSIYPPLGLMYVGAALENDGHDVDILDLYIEQPSKENIKKHLNSQDIIGISLSSTNYKKAAATCNIIREIDTGIPIVIGGPHVTFFQNRSLNDIPDANIAVSGEGENTIVDVARFIQGEKNIADISGICYREGNEIKCGKPLEIIENIDEICFPARHLADKYNYAELSWWYHFKKKHTSMITSRGCPFKCRFCSRYNHIIKNYGYRQRSAENIVKEFLEIDEKFGSVAIVDDNFLADIKRAHKIFDMLIENGTNIELLIKGARVDSTSRELYEKMKKANVKYIEYGIESGNQDVLDFYNKKITLKQIRDAVNLAREMDFFISCNFILGAPIETKKHIKNTIKFASSLPIDIALFAPLSYQKGSDLWTEAVEKNKISSNEFAVTADSRKGLGNFTEEELTKYIKKANTRFYLRPTYLLSQIYRAYIKDLIRK
jgi:anaerobic magnesium-protoporphyrin IX monomethyl ester cyclase